MSNLAEAMERDVQQLQLEARARHREGKERCRREQTDQDTHETFTLIEARRQRCRQERYERYQKVIELSQQGLTQLAMADEVGVSAGTVARWLTAPGFPERSIRSDRHRDRARFLQQTERGLQAPANKTHYSSGRIAGLLMKTRKPVGGTEGARERLLAVLPEGAPASKAGAAISSHAEVAQRPAVENLDGKGYRIRVSFSGL